MGGAVVGFGVQTQLPLTLILLRLVQLLLRTPVETLLGLSLWCKYFFSLYNIEFFYISFCKKIEINI